MNDIAQDRVNSSVKEVLGIEEKIDLSTQEIKELDDNIRDLRDRMTKIELMTENPRIFSVDSMYPSNTAHVFAELENWNEMHQHLKEIIHRWDEKRNELESNVMGWENVVSKIS